MKEHIHQVQQVHFIYSLESKKEHHRTISPDISDLVGGTKTCLQGPFQHDSNVLYILVILLS